MTVGQLREQLAQFSDDAPVVTENGVNVIEARSTIVNYLEVVVLRVDA